MNEQTNQTTTAVIYARYSPRPRKKRGQAEPECESCETQIELAEQYCRTHGLTVLATYRDDGKSGASTDGRQGLQDALEHAKRAKAAFVSYSLSRWARSTPDAISIAEQLEKAGCRLISMKENIDPSTAIGRFAYRLFASLAELEREQTSERTRDAMQRHQRAGRRMSRKDRLPFGWKIDPNDDSRMIEDDAEQDQIIEMQDLSVEGLSYRGIAARLMADGSTCRGRDWLPATIRRILVRQCHTVHD